MQRTCVLITTAFLILGSWPICPGQMTDRPVNLMLSTMPAGKDPQRYPGYVEPKYKELERRSLYLTMRDGVKIAIDLILPKPLTAEDKLPTIMHMTRYWRSNQADQPNP